MCVYVYNGDANKEALETRIIFQENIEEFDKLIKEYLTSVDIKHSSNIKDLDEDVYELTILINETKEIVYQSKFSQQIRVIMIGSYQTIEDVVVSKDFGIDLYFRYKKDGWKVFLRGESLSFSKDNLDKFFQELL